jgi:hypothetical protein
MIAGVFSRIVGVFSGDDGTYVKCAGNGCTARGNGVFACGTSAKLRKHPCVCKGDFGTAPEIDSRGVKNPCARTAQRNDYGKAS